MGKLAQLCEDLAEGTRLEAAWKKLIGNPAGNENSFILTECPRLIQSEKLDEIDLCYRLLETPEAVENAARAHKELFNLDSGSARLKLFRQAIGCAGLAVVSKVPNPHDAGQIEIWARRAMGLASSVGSEIELNGVETSTTLIRKALSSVVEDHDEKRHFADALTCWFSGIELQIEHRIIVPVLLYDQTDDTGVLGDIIFTKLPRDNGAICNPAPRTRLQVEIDNTTRSGIERAWERARGVTSANCEVQWELSGINTISGRSAEAAFSLGFQLLLRGAPYDTRCVITAAVNADDSLAHVSGVNDNGSPKLEIAKTRGRDVTVIVAPANRLSAPEEESWAGDGVQVVACENLEDAYKRVSQQLQQVQLMLRSQLRLICEQASRRFDREITVSSDLQKYCVPMRLARGFRMGTVDDTDAGDSDAEIDSPEDSDTEENDLQRRVVTTWDDFIAKFEGRAVMLGDPGFGKTTLLWNRVATVCQKSLDLLQRGTKLDDIQLAFFLPSSKLESCDKGDAKTIVSLLAEQFEIAPELFDWLGQRIESGNCLLCVDALDEVTDRRIVTSLLGEFAKSVPRAQVILTTRLTGFSDAPFDVETDNRLELMPFDRDQIKAAVETWFLDDADQALAVWNLVSSDQRLMDVLRSPVLLNLARQQIINRLKKSQSLPNWRRRVELYEGFLSLAMDNLHDRASQPLLEMEAVDFPVLIEALALQVWLNNPRETVVDRPKIREILKTQIEKELWGLQSRFPHLLNDLQQAGILVPVAVNDSQSSLMFLHRTIGEYLAGRCLARSISRGDESAWEVIEQKCWSPDWKQVILFCAGCLEDPAPLLDRLSSPEPSETNRFGDDILRHRLLLAAQCLPELTTIPQLRLEEITNQVIGEFRRESSFDEAVAAIRALFVVNARYEGKPIAFSLSRHLTSSRVLDPTAYSDELFDHFLQLLWEACKPDARRGRMTHRNPAPFAASLVAIVDELDIERLNATADVPEEHYWRVIGAVFREISVRPTKTITLNAEFLRRLCSRLFRDETEANVGLRQIAEHLPPISDSLVQQSSILHEAAATLKDPARQQHHGNVYALLGSCAEQAGSSKEIADALLMLNPVRRRSGQHKVVAAMAPSLIANGFLDNLAERISAASERSSRKVGMELLLSLYPSSSGKWRSVAVRAAEEDSQTFSATFKTISEREPKPEFLDLAFDLISNDATKNTGLKCLANFVDQICRLTTDSDVSVNLRLLDRVARQVMGVTGGFSFDDPGFLNHLESAPQLAIRGLLPNVMSMSLKYRACESLVSWLAGRIVEGKNSELTKVVASSFSDMTPVWRERLQTLIAESINPSAESRAFVLALAKVPPGTVVDKLKSGGGSERSKLRVLSALPGGSVSDSATIQLIIDNLNHRQRECRQMASDLLTRIDAASLNDQQCDLIIQKTEVRPGANGLTNFCDLIRGSVKKFERPIWQYFCDPENPGRDAVAALVPMLGDRLIETDYAAQCAETVINGEWHEKLTALRILSQAIFYVGPTNKMPLLKLAANCYQDVRTGQQNSREPRFNLLISRSLLSPFSNHLELVPWLVERLADKDEAVAQFAHRLLVDREAVRERKSEKLLPLKYSRLLSSYTKELPAFEIHSRVNGRLLARLGASQYRVFSTVNGSRAIPLAGILDANQ